MLPVAETGDGLPRAGSGRAILSSRPPLDFPVIAVGRGFSGGHRRPLLEKSSQRRALKTVMVGERG